MREGRARQSAALPQAPPGECVRQVLERDPPVPWIDRVREPAEPAAERPHCPHRQQAHGPADDADGGHLEALLHAAIPRRARAARNRSTSHSANRASGSMATRIGR